MKKHKNIIPVKKDTLKLQNEARGNKIFTSSEEPINMKTGDIWIRVNDDK